MKIQNSPYFLAFALMLGFVAFLSCKQEKKTGDETEAITAEPMKDPFFKLSLAQWSIHKMIEDEGMDPFEFAAKAKAWGFEGVEYVCQLYFPEIDKFENRDEGISKITARLKEESEKAGVQNLLIMVDDEGDLADPDEEARNLAVENHKKWVDAAAELGCHSIRVNTFGTNDPEIWKTTVVDGLKKLSEYAATKNINVLCENHGWLSSDAPKLMEAIRAVDMKNCGTLPDFGNWCVKRKGGENWGDCLETYPDKYEGIEMLMPAAMAVSAKSYDFDDDGNETTIDYTRMLQIVKDAGYDGFIGVEYEGSRLSEEEGILATKKLLINAAQKLN